MKFVRFLFVFLILPTFLLAYPAGHSEGQFCAQWVNVQPSFWWTELAPDELALWKDGVQIGNYEVKTATYYPRLGPSRWGNPIDPPCIVPAAYRQKKHKHSQWHMNGIMGPAGEGEIPHSGTHLRKPDRQHKHKATPRSELRHFGQGLENVEASAKEIPSFGDMASLTFVANDRDQAEQALALFQSEPALAKWRDKYAGRAKAYSLEEFQKTSSAFKLDEDLTFAETGFVGLIQSEAPDGNGQARVHSFYSCNEAGDLLQALRDADPDYDPNESPINPAGSSWSEIQVAVASFLGGVILCLFSGALLIARH